MERNTKAALTNWTLIGTILQLVMVISGHYNEFIAANVFALGGMSISLIAGAGYGAGAATRASAAVGGMLVGGACALIGIAVSFLLGDVVALILAVGTLSSAITGAIGGFVAALVTGQRTASA